MGEVSGTRELEAGVIHIRQPPYIVDHMMAGVQGVRRHIGFEKELLVGFAGREEVKDGQGPKELLLGHKELLGLVKVFQHGTDGSTAGRHLGTDLDLQVVEPVLLLIGEVINRDRTGRRVSDLTDGSHSGQEGAVVDTGINYGVSVVRVSMLIYQGFQLFYLDRGAKALGQHTAKLFLGKVPISQVVMLLEIISQFNATIHHLLGDNLLNPFGGSTGGTRKIITLLVGKEWVSAGSCEYDTVVLHQSHVVHLAISHHVGESQQLLLRHLQGRVPYGPHHLK